MTSFKCSRCGRCCARAVDADVGLPVRTDGSCVHWDPDTRLCTIYDERPWICRVDDIYAAYFTHMSQDEFNKLTHQACIALDGYGE